MQPIFISGIGTGIGKTIVSAIAAKALNAAYWKPVQAGYEDGTDSTWVKQVLADDKLTIFPECYKLKLPASPHIAAKQENKIIDLGIIKEQWQKIDAICNGRFSHVIVEGAGGLMVPLSETAFVADLIKLLDAKLILVSRNYLGSINHSLLTAAACREYSLHVLGWIFNDQYMSYEDEIAEWSGYPKLASIPFVNNPDGHFVNAQASALSAVLKKII